VIYHVEIDLRHGMFSCDCMGSPLSSYPCKCLLQRPIVEVPRESWVGLYMCVCRPKLFAASLLFYELGCSSPHPGNGILIHWVALALVGIQGCPRLGSLGSEIVVRFARFSDCPRGSFGTLGFGIFFRRPLSVRSFGTLRCGVRFLSVRSVRYARFDICRRCRNSHHSSSSSSSSSE